MRHCVGLPRTDRLRVEDEYWCRRSTALPRVWSQSRIPARFRIPAPWARHVRSLTETEHPRGHSPLVTGPELLAYDAVVLPQRREHRFLTIGAASMGRDFMTRSPDRNSSRESPISLALVHSSRALRQRRPACAVILRRRLRPGPAAVDHRRLMGRLLWPRRRRSHHHPLHRGDRRPGQPRGLQRRARRDPRPGRSRQHSLGCGQPRDRRRRQGV